MVLALAGVQRLSYAEVAQITGWALAVVARRLAATGSAQGLVGAPARLLIRFCNAGFNPGLRPVVAGRRWTL